MRPEHKTTIPFPQPTPDQAEHFRRTMAADTTPDLSARVGPQAKHEPTPRVPIVIGYDMARDGGEMVTAVVRPDGSLHILSVEPCPYVRIDEGRKP